MSWLTYAILAASGFGFYNFFVKISADKFSPTVAGIFIALSSFVVAVIATLYFKMSGQNLVFTKSSLVLLILAGIFTALGEFFFLFMYAKGSPITIGNPVVVGGTVLVSMILGVIVLKEPMNITKVAGTIFVLIGLVLLARS